MKAYKKYSDCKCEEDYKCGCDDKFEMDDCHEMDMSCCMPKMPCPSKECVKTYKCFYKLYKLCTYRLYKVCPHCGHEFDYHHHRGCCPRCM